MSCSRGCRSAESIVVLRFGLMRFVFLRMETSFWFALQRPDEVSIDVTSGSPRFDQTLSFNASPLKYSALNLIHSPGIQNRVLSQNPHNRFRLTLQSRFSHVTRVQDNVAVFLVVEHPDLVGLVPFLVCEVQVERLSPVFALGDETELLIVAKE